MAVYPEVASKGRRRGVRRVCRLRRQGKSTFASYFRIVMRRAGRKRLVMSMVGAEGGEE